MQAIRFGFGVYMDAFFFVVSFLVGMVCFLAVPLVLMFSGAACVALFLEFGMVDDDTPNPLVIGGVLALIFIIIQWAVNVAAG